MSEETDDVIELGPLDGEDDTTLLARGGGGVPKADKETAKANYSISRTLFILFSSVYLAANAAALVTVWYDEGIKAIDDKYDVYVYMMGGEVASGSIPAIICGLVFVSVALVVCGLALWIVKPKPSQIKPDAGSMAVLFGGKHSNRLGLALAVVSLLCSVGGFLLLAPLTGTNNTVVITLCCIAILAGSFLIINLHPSDSAGGDGWPEYTLAFLIKQLPSVMLLVNWVRPFAGSSSDTYVVSDGTPVAISLFVYVGCTAFGDAVIMAVRKSGSGNQVTVTGKPFSQNLSPFHIGKGRNVFVLCLAWGGFITAGVVAGLVFGMHFEMFLESHTGSVSQGDYQTHNSSDHFVRYLPALTALAGFLLWLGWARAGLVGYSEQLSVRIAAGKLDMWIVLTGGIASGCNLAVATALCGFNDVSVIASVIISVVTTRAMLARANVHFYKLDAGVRVIFGLLFSVVLAAPTFAAWYALAEAPHTSAAWRSRLTSQIIGATAAGLYILEAVFTTIGVFLEHGTQTYTSLMASQYTTLVTAIGLFSAGAGAGVFFQDSL